MFGLLGANGAGKSTLMRTVAALQEPTEGSITLNDVDIIKSPQEVRKILGYLPQEFGVYPKVNAYQLLDHLAILKGILDKKSRKTQITELLEQTNLYQHKKKSVHTFSGGMKQRFGIAQALLADPQVIIVDEPTAGLDPEERNRFLNLLSEIGQNVIVILSTHIVGDVKELCTQMAILSEGAIIAQGSPLDLVASISGKIWSCIIPKNQLDDYKEKYQVISTRLLSGKTQIRIYSEEQPPDTFTPVTAGLEDYYFTASAQHNS